MAAISGETGLAMLALLNLAGFFLTALDKSKARRGRWRIPERTFFLLAAVGGAIGVYGGCLLFRHKTRHPSFMWGLPAILLAQALLVIWWFRRG
ncbi:uncharacterized membrane protein YsdA (DUF1294 family) [Hydrogenispora ethanolica]|uniref:Uncharacterized membrane protein YsdA (DUF1294 family) n=1 Tax=Hydrogenispora ethanolica TaxID=1082276 RepID=A0A4R1QUG8_HYDET|nr:DUF1294 domain-containing protein [Hydrogenispora ethanolica]TCL56823.1 uncharacterized membrane protein YsdA (DUF1294 family) [Hydrogenispora ethanolica]